MRRRTHKINLLLLVLPLVFAEFDATAGTNLYVSPAGNDSWSGTLTAPNSSGNDGPFKTLTRARDAIRKLKEKGRLTDGGVTVQIRAGTYRLTETFQLTEKDSGTAGKPIVYRAYRNEKAQLLGGKEVRGFPPIRDPAILSRIEKACRGEILRVDIKRQGITDFGEMKPRGFGRPTYPAGPELFFQDKPMQLARWPNLGWVKIAVVPAGKQAGRFTYEGDRTKRWEKADDIWLHGYWTQEWADSYEKVKSIDTSKREIATHKPHGVYRRGAG